jgi:diaminopimelate decarboxylase
VTNVNPFSYRNGRLFCEELPVAQIAQKVETPFYLYSQSAFEDQFRTFDQAFAPMRHLTCYAVKANSNIAVLSLFRRLGAGFDIVSQGEMMRALAAGADPGKIIYSGVGKRIEEIDLGLAQGILQFNVESAAEMQRLEARARALGKPACVALRVNPGIDAGTHPYIATGLREHKFGITIEDAWEIYRSVRRSRHIHATGIACHIGSQITSVAPFLAAMKRLKRMCAELRGEGIEIRHLDLGGGLGITYDKETPPHVREYARAVMTTLGDLDCTLILEPGRVIVGNAGILVTRVVLTKRTEAKNFVVIDAGMSELIRPSLYGSYHAIREVVRKGRRKWKADVVGPICESGDFIARDRNMPMVRADECLAIMSAGAYGFVLSSNYNTRLRPAEVMVRQDRYKIIRKREQFQDLIRNESRHPFPVKSPGRR